jgi:hypothetical protein
MLGFWSGFVRKEDDALLGPTNLLSDGSDIARQHGRLVFEARELFHGDSRRLAIFDGCGRPFVSATTTLRGGAGAPDRRRPDPEVIKLFPGPECCSQPTWLFSATGPSFGRPDRISVLRKNLRVWAPRVAHFFSVGSWVMAKLVQFLLKNCLFGRYLARQYRDD